MPIAPLFVADMDTLKSSLRLSGAAASDADALIERAVQRVRLGFYDALEPARVTALQALSYTENPTDADGVMRLKANQTEISWVRLYLLREMPVLFMDASASVNQAWNEEGLTREAGFGSTRAEISRLESEVRDALIDLKGHADPDPGEIAVSVIEPDSPPPRPFSTLTGGRGW